MKECKLLNAIINAQKKKIMYECPKGLYWDHYYLSFCCHTAHFDSIQEHIQLEADVFNPPDIFPLIPIVNNKLCNIECCVNNMLQIIQNMMVSQCSELELSMFRGTTLLGQHPLIYIWVQNLQKYSTP